MGPGASHASQLHRVLGLCLGTLAQVGQTQKCTPPVDYQGACKSVAIIDVGLLLAWPSSFSRCPFQGTRGFHLVQRADVRRVVGAMRCCLRIRARTRSCARCLMSVKQIQYCIACVQVHIGRAWWTQVAHVTPPGRCAGARWCNIPATACRCIAC